MDGQDRMLAEHYAQEFRVEPITRENANDDKNNLNENDDGGIEVTDMLDMDSSLAAVLKDLAIDNDDEDDVNYDTIPHEPSPTDGPEWSTEATGVEAFPSMFTQSPPIHAPASPVVMPEVPPQPNFDPQLPVVSPPSVAVSSDGEVRRTGILHSHLMLPLPKKHYSTMGKSEMAFIIRSQLRQLQSADPLSEDFYYQVHSTRQGKREVVAGFPTLEGFHANVRSRNADGSVKRTNNTLGRLEASNLRRPKKLMDLFPTGTHADGGQDDESVEAVEQPPLTSGGGKGQQQQQQRRTGMFSRHSLMFLAEEGIRKLMDMEDIDSELFSIPPLPQFAMERERLERHRHITVSTLCAYMDLTLGPEPRIFKDGHMLYGFSTVRKGRLLLLRSLLLLPPPIAEQIVFAIVTKLDVFALRKDAYDVDTVLANVCADFVPNMPFGGVCMVFMLFLNKRNSSNMIALVQSMLGCALALKLLRKGHEEHMHFGAVCRNEVPPPPFPMDAWKADLDMWRSSFEDFVLLLVGKLELLFARHRTHENTDNGGDGATGAASDLTRASIESLWDLIAAVVSQAARVQHEALKVEVRSLLLSDVSPLKHAEDALNSHPADEPWTSVPFVSGAVHYLCTLCLPDDERVMNIFKRLGAIQVVVPEVTVDEVTTNDSVEPAQQDNDGGDGQEQPQNKSNNNNDRAASNNRSRNNNNNNNKRSNRGSQHRRGRQNRDNRRQNRKAKKNAKDGTTSGGAQFRILSREEDFPALGANKKV